MKEVAIAAVVGHPVSHSRSPAIFAVMAKAEKRPVTYTRLDVAPEKLAAFFTATVPADLFVGWNVTIPHKEAVAKLVDTLSPTAKGVGAVNVVHFAGKKVAGHNTDVLGIRETLRERRTRVAGKTAMLYGAGGAARAVAYALGKERARRVAIVNRSPDRARALARAFGRQFPRTDFVVIADPARFADEVTLVVNATPAGMKGRGGRLILPRFLAPRALAFDLVYRPAVTSFLRAAERRGARIVNGLDMLVWQAIATWEIWFGRVRNRGALKSRIERALEGR